MPSSTKSAGTGTDDGSAGTMEWFDPNDIISSNDLHASSDYAPSGNDITHYLRATNFGFAIPPGDTIDGIVVSIERRAWNAEPESTVYDNSITLLENGVPNGDDKAVLTAWPADDGIATYGGSTDIWGTTLNSDTVNASNFGVQISVVVEGTVMYAEIDHIEITVYYSSGGGGGPPTVPGKRATLWLFLNL